MPRDVLGLDPYQRSAISCARVGCLISFLSLLVAVMLHVYETQQPTFGKLHLLVGPLVMGSVLALVASGVRLGREVRARE